MDVLGIILPIVYILAGCALIWFIVELALATRKVRSTVTDLKEQVDPALANVNKIANQLPPMIDKVDPILDRVTLTVDSVNLELMRVDEMLEDVTQITGTLSKATTAVDTVTSAPLDIVTNMTSKVRGFFKPKYASKETQDISSENSTVEENPIVEFANAAVDAAEDAVREHREIHDEKKRETEEEESISTSDVLDVSEASDAGSDIRVSSDILLNVETGSIHADIDEDAKKL